MNNKLTGVGIFIVGAALGVGGSYKFFKTKYQTIADEEIESVKMAFKNKEMKAELDLMDEVEEVSAERDREAFEQIGRMDGEGSIITTPKDESIERLTKNANGDLVNNKGEIEVKKVHSLTEKNEQLKEALKKGINARTKRDKIDYSAIATKYNKEAAEVKIFDPHSDDDEIDETINAAENDPTMLPYVITCQSFVSDFIDNEKVTLTYYEGDKVLVDEDLSRVNNSERIIGDALSSFGIMDEEENLVYVRNEQFGIDYEVIKVEEHYSDQEIGN